MDTWWYGIRQRPLSWSRHICMLGTAATGTGTGNLQQANLQQPTCNLSAIIVAQKCKAFLCRRLLRLILKHRRVNWCLWWRWIVLMWLVVATATCYMQHATPMRSLARNLPWNFKHWRISAISFILYMYIYIYFFFIRFMHFCLAVAAAENCISWLAAMKRQQQHVLCSPLWPLDISLGRDNAPQPNQAIIKAGPAI